MGGPFSVRARAACEVPLSVPTTTLGHMSLALYRTYRPGRFADLIGQDHVTVPLMRALTANRAHHAYLFSGPRGCGKTSSARILARSLNCEQGPTADPCGVCQSCIELAPNGPGSIDVIELDAASNRGIDQARELREKAVYAPAASRFKIYIIDEAHQLTTEAANALLKLVEEPPEHLRFVFATTEPDKLLGTIRSRTHHYPFRLVPAKLLVENLAMICAKEGVAADPAALALVARASGGSVRDAQSILGQLVGGAGPEGVTYADALSQLGFTNDRLLDAVIDALGSGSGAELFSVIDDVVTGGHDPRRFVTDLLERLRDLIILSAAPEAAEHGLIDAPEDRFVVLRSQAEALGLPTLSRAADTVSDGLSALRGATAPRLQLELLAARLLLPAGEAGVGALVARLDAMERRVSALPVHTAAVALPAAAAPAVAPASAPAAAPTASKPRKLSEVAPSTAAQAAVDADPVVAELASAPAREPTPVASPERPAPVASPAPAASPATAKGAVPVDVESIRTLWPAVLESVKAIPGGGRTAWTVFADSAPKAVNGDELVVALPQQGSFTVARSRNLDAVLATAVAQVVRRALRIDLVLDQGAKAPAAAAADASTDATTKPPRAAKGARARAEAAVAAQEPASDAAPDTPSVDDEDAEDVLRGIELAKQALGGVVIAEVDADA